MPETGPEDGRVSENNSSLVQPWGRAITSPSPLLNNEEALLFFFSPVRRHVIDLKLTDTNTATWTAVVDEGI